MEKKTVMALMLDDNQPWFGHFEATSNEQAMDLAQLAYYNDNLRAGANSPDSLPELPEGLIPNVLRILVVFDGHVSGDVVGQDIEVPELYRQTSTRDYLLANPLDTKENKLEWLLSSRPNDYIPAPIASRGELRVGVFGTPIILQMVGISEDGVDLRGDTGAVNCLRHTTILPFGELDESGVEWCLELLAWAEKNKV